MSTTISTLDKFLLAFQAEGLKLKRRKMIKLSYLIPLSGLVLLSFIVIFVDDYKAIIQMADGALTINDALDLYFAFFMTIMFPVMIAIYTASISSIEREAKTEFTLGVLPTSPFLVFLSKIAKNLLNTIIGVFIGISSVMVFSVIANHYLEWFPKEYELSFFLERLFYSQVGSFLFLPIIILHTWLGERFNIKLLNMFGIMFIGLVAIGFNAKGTYIYIPHSLPMEVINSYKNIQRSFALSLTTYFAYIVGLLGLAYYDLEKNIFQRRK